jgi:hypothetical protein
VIRVALPTLLGFLLFAMASLAQETRPLGDIARESRAARPSSPKSTRVLTNDDIVTGKSQIGSGQLSQDKQAFCNALRLQKDPGAEQCYVLLSINMGPEYESLTDREINLAKNLCGAGGGPHLPTSLPKDPTLAAQYRELSGLNAKFRGMMETEMKAYRDAEEAVNTVRQEKYHEEADLPSGRNSASPPASVQERQRSAEIEDKYKSRLQQKEEVAGQIKVRGLRFLFDSARLQQVCDRH